MNMLMVFKITFRHFAGTLKLNFKFVTFNSSNDHHPLSNLLEDS